LINENDTVELLWTDRNGSQFVNITMTGVVSAVIEEIGSFSFSGGPSDTSIYIDIEQAKTFFQTDEINQISVQTINDDEATINGVINAIEALFEDKVSVTAPSSILDTISSVLGIVEIFLVGVAGISLLVAGIGIMNIMIVSLMERTREIGILKALGTTNGTVLLIFLSEAAFIGVFGGVIGIGLGYILSVVAGNVISGFGSGFGGGDFGPPPEVANTTFTITPILTPDVALLALGFGLIISVVFALYPAWRASKLRPVDALRYE
jgi:putative ABC transport system permease protein